MSAPKRFGSRRAVRAYVYSVCASMLNAQHATHPENVEGWMFGGVEGEEDRAAVLAEVKRLECEMADRAAKARSA